MMMTDCITQYINFCVENTIPNRTVRCFCNNKPWIMNVRESKKAYRKILKSKLQQNNLQVLLPGIKNITGFKVKGDQAEGNRDRDNVFNRYFNRLNTGPLPQDGCLLPLPLATQTPHSPCPPQQLPAPVCLFSCPAALCLLFPFHSSPPEALRICINSVIT